MRYKNLSQLLAKNSDSKQYFLSLPIGIQMELRGHGESIHSATELHQFSALIKEHGIPIHHEEYEHFF
ncbi:MAG: hypothetical protein J6C00_03680 [Eubacterium sp.]|nr:hypothetical protein [Eubacterium sp.]